MAPIPVQARKSANPVALVVGASRGIGRQVALDLARNGYAVAVAGKTTSADPTFATSTAPFPPDPNSPQSTIDTVAREIRDAGGAALPVPVDVRSAASVDAMVSRAVGHFGALDVVVYNAGAVWWGSVLRTPVRRFALLQAVNPEGLYAVVQAALPHFRAGGWKGRVVVVSPPIYSRFFRGKAAYAMGKVGMSVLTKGLAMDFEREGLDGMAICSVWPAVAIESGVTRGSDGTDLRRATIFSDAILGMLRAPVAKVNGALFSDEDFLREECGVQDFEKYNVVPGTKPRRMMPAKFPDLTVEEQSDEGSMFDSAESKKARKRTSKI